MFWAVPDRYLYYASRIQEYLPKSNNRSDSNVRRCIWWRSRESRELYRGCGCRVGCKAVSIKTTHFISNVDNDNPKYIKFEINVASNIITNVTEIATYPSTKFLPDIGGLLGLFSGMSVLSIIELIVCIVLTIVTAFHKVKRFINTRHFRQNQDIQSAWTESRICCKYIKITLIAEMVMSMIIMINNFLSYLSLPHERGHLALFSFSNSTNLLNSMHSLTNYPIPSKSPKSWAKQRTQGTS